MSFLAIFGGIAVLVWFYLTAKERGEERFKWAIIGLIGYWIAWWAVKLTVVNALSGLVVKSPMLASIVILIPALCAIAAAFLIRKKLIADADAAEK